MITAMADKTEIREDGSVRLVVRHRKGERANPQADDGILGFTFEDRDKMANFLRTFTPPDTECYYDMGGLDLSGLDLTGAKMPHVYLRGADLTNTRLCDVEMPFAWLRGAQMGQTDMTGADVTRARVDDQVFGPKVISASDTFNNVVNKPTKSEKKAMRRMAKKPAKSFRR